MPSFRDLPNPGIKPKSPTLQMDSLPSEPPRKPKNTRVGSLTLLQGIFPIQELHWDFIAFQVDSLPAELPGNLTREDTQFLMGETCYASLVSAWNWNTVNCHVYPHPIIQSKLCG